MLRVCYSLFMVLHPSKIVFLHSPLLKWHGCLVFILTISSVSCYPILPNMNFFLIVPKYSAMRNGCVNHTWQRNGVRPDFHEDRIPQLNIPPCPIFISHIAAYYCTLLNITANCSIRTGFPTTNTFTTLYIHLPVCNIQNGQIFPLFFKIHNVNGITTCYI